MKKIYLISLLTYFLQIVLCQTWKERLNQAQINVRNKFSHLAENLGFSDKNKAIEFKDWDEPHSRKAPPYPPPEIKFEINSVEDDCKRKNQGGIPED